MKKLVYYSTRPQWKGVDFSNCVKQTVPNQAMSLKEIINRFVRRQSVPVEHEGSYHDRFDTDLEKLSHYKTDIIDKEDFVRSHRAYGSRMKSVLEAEAERIKLEELKKMAPPPTSTNDVPPK